MKDTLSVDVTTQGLAFTEATDYVKYTGEWSDAIANYNRKMDGCGMREI